MFLYSKSDNIFQLWRFGDILCMFKYGIEQNTRFFHKLTPTKDNLFVQKSDNGAFPFCYGSLANLSLNFISWYLIFGICCFKFVIKLENVFVSMPLKRVIKLCWFVVFFCKIWVIIFPQIPYVWKLFAILLWYFSLLWCLEHLPCCFVKRSNVHICCFF